MSALSIQPTYPILTDIDGQPLENGFVWVGTANLDPQANPITAYWDAALTQVATQPVRTRGGYPLNGTSVGRLYVNSDYSILVQNRNGATVYSAPAATERYGNIIISAADVSYTPGPNSLLTSVTAQAALDDLSDDEDGSSYVGFLQSGTNAVATTVQTKLRETVSVFDFMTAAQIADVQAGTASIDVATAIQDAINYGISTGAIVFVPRGTYGIAQELLIADACTLVGEGSADVTIFKATAAIDSIIRFQGTAGYLGIEKITFNGNSLATDGLRIFSGINESSRLSQLYLLGAISKQLHVTSYLYTSLLSQIRASGGEYGIYVRANSPFQGAVFDACRVSNTTITAIHLENTGANVSLATFITPTTEGNRGAAYYVKNTRLSLFDPWFESNGSVTGDPDILIEAASSIITRVTVEEGVFSSASVAQNDVRAKLLSSHCQLVLRGGNDVTMYVDGNNQSSSCFIDIGNRVSTRIINYIGNFATDAVGVSRKSFSSYNTTPTKTNIPVWGRGSILVMAQLRTTNVITAGLYLVTLDNPPGSLRWKTDVACATTANITLSGEQTIDGVLTSSSRVLVKNQSTTTENGIYVSSAGAWSRASDADSDTELLFATVNVSGGSTLSGTSWRNSNTTMTIGTTAVTFAQLSGGFTATLLGGSNVATFTNSEGRLAIERSGGSEGLYNVIGTFQTIYSQLLVP